MRKWLGRRRRHDDAVRELLGSIVVELGRLQFSMDGKSLDARIDKRTDAKLRQVERRVATGARR